MGEYIKGIPLYVSRETLFCYHIIIYRQFIVGIVMERAKQELIHEYLVHVLDVNKRINVTSITDYDEAVLLHIQDSLAVLPEINEAPEGLYGDLGSGGGFPGVPLGVFSERETVLIDSIQKKMKMVHDILSELDISNISTYSGRIEEYPCSKPRFTVLTARALSSLPSLLELSSPLLQMNGHLICLKARIPQEEIYQSKELENTLGMKFLKERSYVLENTDIKRTVLVYEKYKEPSISLPRRVGMAQKRPLKLNGNK